jgi:hypothetical protein
MTTGTFTEQDAQTFATKLEAFSRTLTTGEQAILTLVEQQLGTLATATTDDDVQGFMFDLGTVASIRQRELLHEAERVRAGMATGDEQSADITGDRTRFWQRLAIALGQQATAMAPRTTGQPATG